MNGNVPGELQLLTWPTRSILILSL